MVKIADYIGEATEYDKKELLEERRPRSWLKSVSAFANGIGGALIFGVSDEEELVGLPDAKDISEKISELIKTKMDPIPQIVLEIHSEDEKEFIIVKVSAGQETPYYYTGDGNRLAYVRVGNESIPASAVDLKRLVLRGSNITFDSLSTRYPFEGYAFTKFRSVYRQRTGLEMDSTDFLSFGMVDEHGMLTNAGALLADESPMRFSRIFCTRWYGVSKASGIMEALDDKEVSGSLITLLQSGEEFVRNNTKKRWKKTETGRIEMPEYPERAVLECIVNALIHRDYMIPGSEVHIDIFDDRMEIYSPGGMADGTRIQERDVSDVSSIRRNPVIADIFSRMNYMERRGSGFKKIREDYFNAFNFQHQLEPKFYSDLSSFIVTLYNLNYNVPVEKTVASDEKQALDDQKTGRQVKKQAFEILISRIKANKPTRNNIERIYVHFGTDTVFSRADVMEITGLTATPASELMRKLKTYGIIMPVKGRGKYKFIEPQG